jgi:hypothetical protein
VHDKYESELTLKNDEGLKNESNHIKIKTDLFNIFDQLRNIEYLIQSYRTINEDI